MAATIQVNVKDNSKEAMESLKKRFEATGVEAKKLDGNLEELGKELESRKAATATEDVKKLADELLRAEHAASEAGIAEAKLHDEMMQTARAAAAQDGQMEKLLGSVHDAAMASGKMADVSRDLAQAMDAEQAAKYKREIEALAKAMSTPAKGFTQSLSTGWTELASKLEIAKKGFEAIKFAFDGVQSAVAKFTDMGIPAFERLSEAGARFQNSLLEIGHSQSFQRLADVIANKIDDTIIPAVIRWIDWLDKALDFREKSETQTRRAMELNAIDMYFDSSLISKKEADRQRAEVHEKYPEEADERADRERKEKREADRKAHEDLVVANKRKQVEEDRMRAEEEAQAAKEQLENLADPGKKLRADAEMDKQIEDSGLDDLEKQIDLQKRIQNTEIARAKGREEELLKNKAFIESAELLLKLEQRRLVALEDLKKYKERYLAYDESEEREKEIAKELELERERTIALGGDVNLNKKLIELQEKLTAEQQKQLSIMSQHTAGADASRKERQRVEAEKPEQMKELQDRIESDNKKRQHDWEMQDLQRQGNLPNPQQPPKPQGSVKIPQVDAAAMSQYERLRQRAESNPMAIRREAMRLAEEKAVQGVGGTPSDLARLRSEARRDFTRRANRGELGNEVAVEAVNSLTAKQVENMKSSTTAQQTMQKTIRELNAAVAEQQLQLARLQDEADRQAMEAEQNRVNAGNSGRKNSIAGRR